MVSFASTAVLFLVSLFVFTVAGDDVGSYDVCVIGGGGSGAASAVFLKDLGYNVKVIEKTSALGGHCNTIDFTAPNGQSLWLDIGVQFYVNTTNANLNGFGTWALDTVGFISRFVPASLQLGMSAGITSASYGADFLTGAILNTAFNVTEFEIAFNTLFGFVVQFPWINTGERPDPLPAVFLEPFSKFIADNHLEVLVDPLINGFTFAAGVGSLEGMSTLQGLWYQSAVNLLIATGGQNSAVSFIGGCQVLYDGIASHLGESAVTYNAEIKSVRRSSHPSVIKGKFAAANGRRTKFQYNCDNIVVSVYPLLQNLVPWFDLTEKEASLFSNMIAQGYLAMGVSFTDGPLVANQSFGIANFDPTRLYNLPALPNLSLFQRDFTFGPAAAWVNAETTCTTTEEMLEVARTQFEGINSQLLTNVEISAYNYHQYGPHWTTSSEATSPSPNTRLIHLQGSHNTYWVGAGAVTEGSHVVWNHAYKLINANFPRKH